MEPTFEVFTGELSHDEQHGWIVNHQTTYRDNHRSELIYIQIPVIGDASKELYALVAKNSTIPKQVKYSIFFDGLVKLARIHEYTIPQSEFYLTPKQKVDELYDKVMYEIDNNMQVEFKDRLCKALITLFAKEILDLRTWNGVPVEIPIMTRMFYETLITETKNK